MTKYNFTSQPTKVEVKGNMIHIQKLGHIDRQLFIGKIGIPTGIEAIHIIRPQPKQTGNLG